MRYLIAELLGGLSDFLRRLADALEPDRDIYPHEHGPAYRFAPFDEESDE